ncbi:pilus assembly protein PilY [Pseudomonas sp. L-22-4S-12]|uniref:pilus assembly protein n=1 Tax=Pseudomonas sp. L-22-4S-12 TaxID=2610893 RepID=UPI001323CF4E|nr:PilC/PilY family type IV pilus protein [Pseudomonas sp. L-22-4S-12]MWV16124.1 pilus assembly protein PilY [Pseudomonas sp. L-22-4S-12]
MRSVLMRGLLAAALASASVVHAEDIDLFVGNPPSANEAPNILIVLDNGANWTATSSVTGEAVYKSEMAALASVIGSIPVDRFRVGVMMYSETGNKGGLSNSGDSGAYVRAAIRPLNAANKTAYADLVSSLSEEDKGNGTKLALAMEEAYLYFAAKAPYAGNNKAKTDYTGNVDGTAESAAVYALTGNALGSKAGSPYNSPIASGCAKNFIIYISNGPAQDNNSDRTQAESALAAQGGATTAIPISPSGMQDNPADEWARFMKKSAEQITTYTVEIDRGSQNQDKAMTALMQSVARVSSGKYFSVSSDGSDIAEALNSIFSEIQSVNSVFASVSLPVSVNTQGTYLNQVFVGMFRPDQDALPSWYGNLKQYKLGLVNGDLKLLDAASKSAINSSTGFIAECARSFWTPTEADNYWAFRAQNADACLAAAGLESSNSPDGNIVEKGAQAYVLRSDAARNVYTCSSCTSLANFNTANSNIVLPGAADDAERDAMINWLRGQDLKDEDGDANLTEMRPSVHGDVVHSRPVAINYGTASSPDVVVFYGGNDGALRAVNGNRSGTFSGSVAGAELWSFIPPEFYGNVKRLYDNTIGISYPNRPVVEPPVETMPKPYGMDGPVTAYKDADDAWIYATMRRGGRAIYAFDVTDADSPSLLWKQGCPSNFPASGSVDDTGCSSGFSGIGQTWSTPKVFTAAGHTGPLLIMGGGYDTCEDADPNSCDSNSKGNKVYVLDAESGVLRKTFTTERSVVAEVTLVPNAAGQGIYGYTADLGGNVYRINMGSDAPGDWTMTKVASLGCGSSTCTANRKFMFAPDIVADGTGYALLLGSGDREKPLNSYTSASSVTNYFFMLKDRPNDSAWLSTDNGSCGDSLCLSSLQPITSSATPSSADLAGKKGWYLGLSSTEQVVTSAITVFGITTFSTHQPSVPVSGTCASLGETRVYNINYADASPREGEPRFADLAGDGLPPSPVAGMVTLDDGTTVPFVIGANPDSPLEGSPPVEQLSVMQPTSRVFWNVEQAQ